MWYALGISILARDVLVTISVPIDNLTLSGAAE